MTGTHSVIDFFPSRVRDEFCNKFSPQRNRVPVTLLCTLLFLSLLIVAPTQVDAAPGDVYLIDSKSGANWFEILHGQSTTVTPHTPREGLIETWFGNFSQNTGSSLTLKFESIYETVDVFTSNDSLIQFEANVTWDAEYQIRVYNNDAEGKANITSYAVWSLVVNETLSLPEYDFQFVQGPDMGLTATEVSLSFMTSLAPFTYTIAQNETVIRTDTIHTVGVTTHIWSRLIGLQHVELSLVLGADPNKTLYWHDWYGNDTSSEPFRFIDVEFHLNQTHVQAVGTVNRGSGDNDVAIRVFENGTQRTAQYTEFVDVTISSFNLIWLINPAYFDSPNDTYVIVSVQAEWETELIDTSYDYTITTEGVVTEPTTTTTTPTTPTTRTQPTFPIDWSVLGPQLALGAIALLVFMLISYLFVLNEKSKEEREEKGEPSVAFTKLVGDSVRDWKKSYMKKLRKPPKGKKKKDVTRRRMANRVLIDIGTEIRHALVLIVKAPYLLVSGARRKAGDVKESREYKDWQFEPEPEEDEAEEK